MNLRLVALSLFACGPALPGGGAPDAEVPAVDAGPPAVLELETIAASPVVIAPVRDHHTTLVAELDAGAFLYVFGGTNAFTVVHSDVQRAAISPDGGLGAFAPVGQLPEPLAGHATVLVGRRVVLTGGITQVSGNLVLRRSTAAAELRDDGSLGAWVPGPSLPVAVMHHTCAARGAAIYCVGGRISGNDTSTLAVQSRLEDDGTLAPFTPMPSLPHSLGFHVAFLWRDGLYVAGGLQRDAPMTDFIQLRAVLRSALDSDGAAGPWLEVSQLPEPRNVAAAEVVGDCVFISGGMNANDEVLSTVVAADLSGAGPPVFETLPVKLPAPRMHVHQTPHYGGAMFWVGGRDTAQTSLGSVAIGSLVPAAH